MINEMDIYWITRLDHIHALIIGILHFTMILAVICGLISFATGVKEYSDGVATKNTHNVPMYISIFMLFLFSFFGVVKAFVPTTKEFAAIKVIPIIANNKEVQGLGTDIVDLAKDWVKELKPSSLTTSKTVEAEKGK